MQQALFHKARPTRRQFLAASTLAFGFPGIAAAIDSKLAGVQIGAQSYSFRDRPLDEMIAALVEIGLGECELWQGHVEPRSKSADARDQLRTWRTTVALDFFGDIRRKFDRAGIKLSAYNYSFRDDFTENEIERGFEMAKALGV